MRTKIELKGIHFYAYHGYYEEERKMGNPFIVNVQVYVNTFDDDKDSIDDTVNYEDLYQICEKEMTTTQLLLETVVFNIVENIQKKCPQAKSGKVSIEKIGPQLGGKVEKAIIEMEF